MSAKKENELEERIKSALYKSTERLTVSPDVKRRIDSRLCKESGSKEPGRKEKEVYSMKYWNTKKIVILTAVICLIVSTVCLAAVKYKGSVSVSPADAQIGTYSQLMQKAEDLGITAHLPESFQNGYTFKEAFIVSSWDQLEDGSKSEEREGLSIVYIKDNMPSITIDAKKATSDGLNSANGKVKTTLYRIVPEDYEVTPEDQKAMEAGNLMLSGGGSDTVLEQELKSISIESDGFLYILLTWDTPLDDTVLQQMTGELLQQ